MPDYTIREAVPADAQDIIDLLKYIAAEPDNNITWNDSAEVTWTLEEEEKIIQNFNDTDNKLMLVLEAGGQVRGVLTLQGGSRQSNRHVAGLGISLHGDYRGQGIGTQMLKHALVWARATGIIHRVELEVFSRNRAISLYKRLGFVEEGRRKRAFLKGDRYVDSIGMALLLGTTGKVTDPRRLTQLKNIGPNTARWLNEIGIHSVSDLERLGVVEAWLQVKERNPQASLVGLYALQGALMNLHWNALPKEIRDDLRERFESG